MIAKSYLYGATLLLCLAFLPDAQAQEVILDDFEYEDPGMIFDNYNWLGAGEAYLADLDADSHAMELYLFYDGAIWGSCGVQAFETEPFSFQDGQVLTYDIKGDPENFTNDGVVLVFQFRDSAGEISRFLDYTGPKSSAWTTIRVPFRAFADSPWDANPDVSANLEDIVNWEILVQGVGGEVIDPYEATIYLDNIKINDEAPAASGDQVLDDYEYENQTALTNAYAGTGTSGLGSAQLSTDSVEGANSMKLAMSFDGGIWGYAGVRSMNQAPFAFNADQAIRYQVKGDPDNLVDDAVLIVFQLRDDTGEVIRYLDAVGPKSAEWTTITASFSAFEENPWDAHPDIEANRGSLIGWEISIQGVGGEPVDAFEAAIYIDQLEIITIPSEPVDPNYTVNRIDPADAPDVTDDALDAVYAESANEISQWEDDSYLPVGEPYNMTRSYILTDGVKLYCAFVLVDPDTSSLVTDSENDTLLKWQTDSWEIVFAPNPGTVDGQEYVKFAGDSAGYWDDISPDTAGGTDWNAPSFQYNAYIIDANTWAAEFSVDIADIEHMFTGYDSYGHIGMQVKDPGLNFAFPSRSSFSSRDAHWDLSALEQPVPVAEWQLF